MTYTMRVCVIVAFFLLLCCVCSSAEARRNRALHFTARSHGRSDASQYCTPKVQSVDVCLEYHDGHHEKCVDSKTFPVRVLTCDKFYKAGTTTAKNVTSPILFYTGNEGEIEAFYNNTGVMFEIASKVNAYVVFCEHRYYGHSLPFGNKSFTQDKIGYLSVENALLDFVSVIHWAQKRLHGNESKVQSKVVSFGGSYGGMLSAWLRMHYPDVVVGAIAASAPILQTAAGGHYDPDSFAQVVTKDFEEADQDCPALVKQGMQNIYNAPHTWSFHNISQKFRLCDPIQNHNDTLALLAVLEVAMDYAAMVDYPYPNSFLMPLPANCVNAMCQAMLQEGLVGALNVYYNYTGNLECFSTSSTNPSPALGETAWNYQACTQLILPDSVGENSMFYPTQTWNLERYEGECVEQFGEILLESFDPLWMAEFNFLRNSSNIVFSNGGLDPWYPGSVYDSRMTTKSNTVIFMQDAAHHLDLRAANSADPKSVKDARATEFDLVQKWIA